MCVLNLAAQSSFPHWLTSEERALYSIFDRDFEPTDPPVGPVRAIAEFEPMEGVIVNYTHRAIPYELVREIAEDLIVVTIVASQTEKNQAISNYQANSVDMDNCRWLIAPTDSQWTRDYSPWFIFDGNNEPGIVNFNYNRPRPNDNDIPVAFGEFDTISVYGMDVEQTGGNFMCDGLGVGVSTDLVYEENTNYTAEQIAEIHDNYLGLHTYHLRPDPLDDYIKHIDCWGKFLNVDKVLIGQVPESDYRYEEYEAAAEFFENQTSSWGTPYKVYRVFTPGGYNHTNPYTNSLIINNKVIIPIAGDTHDAAALAVYEEAMPGYEVIGMMEDPYNGWLNTDALHCRTHEIPDFEMLYIHHMPIAVEPEANENVSVSATVFPYSESSVISDSVRVFYRVEGDSDYTAVVMTAGTDYNYTAEIPGYADDTTIEYYIRGVDVAGKSANHPYIGAPDPHKFTFGAGASDTTPPVITHTQLTGINNEELPVTVTAEVTDESVINSVYMEYKFDANDADTLHFTDQGSDVWSGDFTSFVENADTLYYRIYAIDVASNTAISPNENWFAINVTTTDNEDIAHAEQNLLLGNYPNPFNTSSRGTTEIKFFLTADSNVDLDIFNVKGQKIRNLTNARLREGNHSITWDGLNTEGNKAATGVYLIKLSTDKTIHSSKMMLLK
jgi:agmatine/peptidylarginine deiminase